MTGIYKIINKIDQKIYIGQSNNINKRLKYHKSRLNNNNHINKHLQSAWNKYDKDAFKFEVYIECKPEELNDWEIFLIKAYNTTNSEYGYNIGVGGENSPMLGKKLTEEHRKRISEAHKGKNPKPFTEEHKRNLSINHVGTKGKKASLETRLKISINHVGNKGRFFSKEIKQKMSESHKGKKMSEESRIKMSESAIKRWSKNNEM